MMTPSEIQKATIRIRKYLYVCRDRYYEDEDHRAEIAQALADIEDFRYYVEQLQGIHSALKEL